MDAAQDVWMLSRSAVYRGRARRARYYLLVNSRLEQDELERGSDAKDGIDSCRGRRVNRFGRYPAFIIGLHRSLGTVVLVGLLAVGCAQHTPPRVDAGTGPALPSTPTALPDFSPQEFTALLGKLRDRPVVVNVWASWCPPCVVEAPDLARVAREYRGRVRFIGVDIQDQRGAARAFIRKYGWTFPSVFDPPAAIRDDLGFVGQPITLVLDRGGRRTFVWDGAVTADRLRKELEPLVSS